MELFSLLSEIPMLIFGDTYNVIDLDFIGKFIRWLVTITGSVGVAIIIFSLLLKLVTLPFDIYQRISMRKQNLKMKQNQERMEKLQKQYANDKEAYNQKVMEMYKEGGMSVFSSCLPMIFSLVIFFVAINAFNSYAAYANVENYNTMVAAYNAELIDYSAELKDENLSVHVDEKSKTVTYTVKDEGDNDKYFYYTVLDTVNADRTTSKDEYKLEEVKAFIQKAEKNYFVDKAKVNAKADETMASEIDKLEDAVKKENADWTAEQVENQAIVNYFTSKAQDAVVVAYAEVEDNASFLWIRNIWVTDAMYKNPVMDYRTFSTETMERGACSCKAVSKTEGIKAYSEEGYELITAKLTVQKEQANGYFVLIALSIGTILLQQFVSMQSQKEQQKYSSVDGQGAGQQKMMMFIMTGMFAIFSFMYSSAFSIYLIVSNLFSLVSTLVINKGVDIIAAKKEQKAEQAKYNKRFPGRVQKAEEKGKKQAKERQLKTLSDKDDKKKQ